MLRVVLVFAAALGCFSLVALAQPSAAQIDKKADAGKSKDDTNKSLGKDSGKAKTTDKSADAGKEMPKAKLPLDQLKLPNDIVIVVVSDLLKATSMIPNQWVTSYEEYLALQERIKTLERQLKGNRKSPSACKLYGKLDGDFLAFRVEYVFSTEQPKTIVPLGLQGGLLTEGGDLDKLAPFLDLDKDDGFTARIEKEASRHQLTLNFRVPVKKSASGGIERSIDLGLPGAAVTILDLVLPAGVKELRWNGTAEKPLTPGRWQIGLEKSKSLNLAWKEPLPPSGNAPLAKVESHIKVDVDATHVNITADLFLEDSRPKTEEWHLYLPAQAKVEAVKAPPGLFPKLEEKAGYAILRVPVTSDRWQVTLSQRVPRPNPGVRIPVGPYHVLGAYPQQGMPQVFSAFQQHGTITVKMPAEASLGQRIVSTRFGEVNQIKNAETEAVFEYSAPVVTEKNFKTPAGLKAPLELEWRFEKNQLRTEVEHVLKLRTARQGWEIDAMTRIHVTALFATIGAVDLKLPQPHPRGVALIGTATPGLAFPGSLPWPGMWKTFGMPWNFANPDEFNVTDESGSTLKLVPQDATGKTRVLWSRGLVKQVTLVLKNSLRIPEQSRHIRLELPRPLNTQDRGAKLSIQADERTELLHGPEGAEEPVPDRHRFDLSWDQAPSVVDLAWRPHHREIVTQAALDIGLHEHSAQIQQALRFPRDRSVSGPEAKNTQISLKIPRGIDKVTLLAGGEIINHDSARQTLWVRPSADAGEMIELKLQYDLPIAKKLLNVTPIWPAHGSQEDVKVRVWTPAGVQARLTPELLQRGVWKERSIELVREREQFPSLVLAGYGANLPLMLQIEDVASTSLAAFLADRALVQVRMADDGSQQCQARYLVRKIHVPYIDVKLPLSLSRFRERPIFFLGKHRLTDWKKLDATEKLLRLQLHPELAALPAVLEITYTIPADELERSSFWSTTLLAPVFHSDVVIGQMRWQLTTPAPVIAASFGRNVRAETQWGLQGWMLAPESAGVEGDAWLNGKEPTQPAPAVTFAFAHVSMQPETVYHLPRHWWLLGCSGIFLILTLGAYFSPLPRWAFWLLLAVLGAGLATFALLCPAAWPGVLFGLQPGLLLVLVFISIHWLLQERYRRQLVFLPGFTRPKSGSTITRMNAAKRPAQGSTVDAPAGSADAASSKSAAPPSGT